MTQYELLYFIKADSSEEVQQEILQKVKSLIEKEDGKVLYEEVIGKKELASVFSKQTHGIYFLLQYETSASVNSDLEDYFKISEIVIRHLIIKIKSLMLIQAKKNKPAKKEEVVTEA